MPTRHSVLIYDATTNYAVVCSMRLDQWFFSRGFSYNALLWFDKTEGAFIVPKDRISEVEYAFDCTFVKKPEGTFNIRFANFSAKYENRCFRHFFRMFEARVPEGEDCVLGDNEKNRTFAIAEKLYYEVERYCERYGIDYTVVD